MSQTDKQAHHSYQLTAENNFQNTPCAICGATKVQFILTIVQTQVDQAEDRGRYIHYGGESFLLVVGLCEQHPPIQFDGLITTFLQEIKLAYRIKPIQKG